MPEIKKVFVRGKMNQDLDERLVPRGEYREGQNIQVSNSEDDDVGAVENVLGNKLAYSTGLSNVGDECIGYFVDVANNRIFWFTTDYSEESEADIISMPRDTAGKKMYELAGDSSDPGGYYYIAVTMSAAGGTIGTLSWNISYVVN